MQYSTAELRLKALEDVFAGPEQLHEDLGSKLGEVRELVKPFDDARLQADPDAFPPPRRAKPRKKSDNVVVPSLPARLLSGAVGTLRQFTKQRELAQEFPEGSLAAVDAAWYRLATYDSAIVSMRDGTSAAFYRRDRDQFVLPLHGGPAVFTPETRALQADVRTALRRLLERGQEAGDLRGDLTPEDLIVATSALSRPLPGTTDWDTLASRQIELMIHGLGPLRPSRLPELP
jgi:hypothetical protein